MKVLSKISNSSLWAVKTRSATVLLAALLAAFGNLAFTGLNAEAAPKPAPKPLTDAQINKTLDELARMTAASITQKDLRIQLQKSIGKRFDGDTNALWSSLSKEASFSKKVAGKTHSQLDVAAKASRIPRLQVAIPVHFESWNPSTLQPLVAFFPEGVDDTTIKTITAYDAEGRTVELDAQTEPELPVIVLSLNERTDEIGKLITPQSKSVSTTPIGSSSAKATATKATSYSVNMNIIKLIDDKEPWAKGAAEISMKARSRGCSGTEYQTTNWDNLDHNGDYWAPGGKGRHLGYTTCDVVFYWWEDDGGKVDFTLSFGNFGLGVGMDDDDDLIGGKQIRYSTFKGDSIEPDNFDALIQWTS